MADGKSVTDEDIKACVDEAVQSKAKDWWTCKHEPCGAYVFSEPHKDDCPFKHLSNVNKAIAEELAALVPTVVSLPDLEKDPLAPLPGEPDEDNIGGVIGVSSRASTDGDGKPVSISAAGSAAEEWGQAVDPSTGGIYYYSKATGVVQWDPPSGWKSAQAPHSTHTAQSGFARGYGALPAYHSVGYGYGAQAPQSRIFSADMNPIDMVQAAINRKRQELGAGTASTGFGYAGAAHNPAMSLFKSLTGGHMRWVVNFDASTGKHYYYNTATGMSQWEVPPDYDGPEIEEAVKAADAAAEASGADALTAATGSFLAAAGAASAEDAPTQRAGDGGGYTVVGTFNPVTGRYQDPSRVGRQRWDDELVKSERVNEMVAKQEKLKRKHPELAKPDVNWKEYKAEKKKQRELIKLQKDLHDEEFND